MGSTTIQVPSDFSIVRMGGRLVKLSDVRGLTGATLGAAS
jgi:hypothetical protein